MKLGIVRAFLKSHMQKPWVLGFFMSTCMFVMLFILADIRLASNDDKAILRAFMGFQPGGPVTFNMYVYPLIAWPLYWLSLAFPGVAWFSVVQLLFLWLANAVILKSIIQCFRHEKKPLWHGVIAGTGFLLLFSVRSGALITYTVTASMLGAAAVAHVMSIEHGKYRERLFLVRLLPSMVLFALSISLRSATALPTLAMLCVALLWQAMRGHDSLKPIGASIKPALVAMLLMTAVLGIITGWRALDVHLQGEADDVAWQEARTEVTDYLNVKTLPAQLIEQVDWDETQINLLDNWYTMDKAFSVQAFRKIAPLAGRETRDTPGMAVAELCQKSKPICYAALCVAVLAMASMLWLYMNWQRNHISLVLTIVLAGLICAAMLCFLALGGRMPERAVLTPVLPAAAIVFCMLPICMPKSLQPYSVRGGALMLCYIAAISLLLMSAIPTMITVRHVPPKWAYNTFEDMDQQALSHPDLLLVYSNRLVNDDRVFPDVSAGIPTNITFWGGWDRGSKEYRARLAAFGLDGENFTAADWLNPAIRFVSLNPEPNELLMNYLRKHIGSSVACDVQKISAGLYFQRFFLAN